MRASCLVDASLQAFVSGVREGSGNPFAFLFLLLTLSPGLVTLPSGFALLHQAFTPSIFQFLLSNSVFVRPRGRINAVRSE